MKKHATKHRSTIADISPLGHQLLDEQLRLVVGGLPQQCWKASASITYPGQTDKEQELKND